MHLFCVLCVFSCYSGLVYLQSIIHQHLWNLLVIIPTPTTGAYSLSVYAGVATYILHLTAVNRREIYDPLTEPAWEDWEIHDPG